MTLRETTAGSPQEKTGGRRKNWFCAGRARECLLTLLLVAFLFMLAVSIVFFITFLAPELTNLKDIEVVENTSFRPLNVQKDFKQTTLPAARVSTTLSDTLPPRSGFQPATTSVTAAGKDTPSGYDASITRLYIELPFTKLNPPSRKLYAGDDLVISVKSAGGQAGSHSLFFDGRLLGKVLGQAEFLVEDLAGKEHTITIERDGVSSDASLPVWRTRYGLSLDVRKILTFEQRQKNIDAGKASLRFYDIPNCPNCIVMRPKVATIAEDYRDCVVYELISLWKPGGREELKKFFPDQSKVVTPVIMVEGSNGLYVYMGIVPPSNLISNILDVAPACGDGG